MQNLTVPNDFMTITSHTGFQSIGVISKVLKKLILTSDELKIISFRVFPSLQAYLNQFHNCYWCSKVIGWSMKFGLCE